MFSLPNFESAVSALCPGVYALDASLPGVITSPTGSTWVVLCIYYRVLAGDWLLGYQCLFMILGWEPSFTFSGIPCSLSLWRSCVLGLRSSIWGEDDFGDFSGWCVPVAVPPLRALCDPRRGFWAAAPHTLVIAPAISLHLLAGELVQRTTAF